MNRSLRCVANAFFACLHSTSQFFTSSNFYQNKFPPFIQHLFDMMWNIDDLIRWNNLVVAVDIAIEKLVKPERILSDTILVKIRDLGQMLNMAFATQSSQGAAIRVHGSEHDPCVLDLALYVFWPIIPIHSDRFDRCCGVALRMQELHDTGQVIWLPWRFTNKVGVV